MGTEVPRPMLAEAEATTETITRPSSPQVELDFFVVAISLGSKTSRMRRVRLTEGPPEGGSPTAGSPEGESLNTSWNLSAIGCGYEPDLIVRAPVTATC